jgi:hypothetical protein
MNLFSLWRSTSIEIMYSKRIVTLLYSLVGIIILITMGLVYAQFFNAYMTLRVFDVDAISFIVIGILLFFPLWFVGAVILRACIQRLRLSLWIRGAIKNVSYSTNLSPAEAGYLVDYTYSIRELVATLLDLHFKGVIKIAVEDTHKVVISHGTNTSELLSRYEQTVVNEFGKLKNESFDDFSDSKIVTIAMRAHTLLVDDLIHRKIINADRLPTLPMKILFRIICIIAGFISIILLSTLVSDSESIFTIGYPRYPIEFTQALTLIGIGAIIVAILISSLWPRFNTNYRSAQYAAWIDAAGFYMYVKGVYRYRLSEQNIHMQDTATIRNNTAHAIAYGVLSPTPQLLRKIIALTNL